MILESYGFIVLFRLGCFLLSIFSLFVVICLDISEITSYTCSMQWLLANFGGLLAKDTYPGLGVSATIYKIGMPIMGASSVFLTRGVG